MHDTLLVVEGVVATALDDTNLRDGKDLGSLAMDQRAFGPRRLLVAFADADGRLRGIAHTRRTDPIDLALRACLQFMGSGAAAAVALCDEEVVDGPPPPDLADRFWLARTQAAASGVHLVDWIACDDQLFRSARFALDATAEDWWDVP
jgi:uncharacterized protein YuzB (UPF0349 family)